MIPDPSFLHLIRSRRSIRKFRKSPLDADVLDGLKEAAVRCPTSHNRRHWHFVFVDDPKLLETLSRCKPHGAGFLKHAPLGIVICGDTSVTDVWIEDCAIATHTLHLAAHALGLASCWIQIRNRPYDDSMTADEFIRRALDIPSHLGVLAMLAVGHPETTPDGHPHDQLPVDKIHINGM